MTRLNSRHALVPGHNVDVVDIERGINCLKQLGYTSPETIMVITYALQRWARGEEDSAQRGAIDKTFHGIDLTSWLMVLSAAIETGHSQIQSSYQP